MRWKSGSGLSSGASPSPAPPNEATTEHDLIWPVLETLGWSHYLPRQTTSDRGRLEIPDVLLFADGAAKHAAQAERHGRHRMARLDALFFHLYGLDRSDADYVLRQFPIVRREDEERWGRFLTRDLILAYMNAVAAGDLDSVVTL